jgi:hypothetical protein
LAGIIIYMSAYGASLGPIGWAYLPEIMPPSAMPYIVASNWLTNGIITTFFPIITEHLLHGNPQKLFLFFTIISVFGAVLNWRYMI